MSGSFEDWNEPDRANTERDVSAGLGSSAALADGRQADGRRFIEESGPTVVAGHDDVGNVPPFLEG